jgi:uncharacterized protein (UPF0332 family)
MKTRDEHLKQAKANEAHADALLQNASPESLAWAVTALFYSAVHYGRAFLAASRTPTITSHVGFESYFRRSWKVTPTTPDVFDLYRRLKDESEAARYDCASFSKTQVENLKVNFLVPFRDAILAALESP